MIEHLNPYWVGFIIGVVIGVLICFLDQGLNGND